MKPRPALLVALILLGLLVPSILMAADLPERPTAMALFPGETVLFVRTADARLMIERLQETAMWQMARDPALSGFVESLKGSAQQAYAEKAQENLGVEMEDLTRLPQGEAAFGLVERTNEDPAVVFLVDFGDQVETATTLLERAKERVTEDGGVVGEENLRADTAVTLRNKNDQMDVFGVVQREGVFVAASDPALLASVLDRWDGVEPAQLDAAESEELAAGEAAADLEPAAPPIYGVALEKNHAFATSLQECLQGRDEPPQLIAFVDPIALVRATSGRQTGVKIALATLPALGVDAVEGAAGAVWLATDSWESLVRAHLLIDNPRSGVMRIVRLGSGDRTPPECVPASVANYQSLYLDPQQVFDDIEAVVDRFRYEGSFRELVKKNVSDNIGVDLPEELLPVLDGRLTRVTAFEEDSDTIVNQTVLIVGAKDEEAALGLLARIIEKGNEKTSRPFGEKTFGEAKYFTMAPREADPGSSDERPRRGRGPRMSPTVGVLGGAVVVSTSEPIYKQLIEAQDGTAPRLRDAIRFKLVDSRIRRLAGGKEIAMLDYTNPEAALRHWYQLATSEEVMTRLQGTENPFFKAIRDALDAGDLPPVEDLLKYAAPSGGLIYDTATGFHYIGFSFKRSGG